MTYFVWVDGLRGPAPKNVLHKHKLSLEEEKLTFDQLIEHFAKDIVK